LIRSEGLERLAILQTCIDGEGVQYTLALSRALPRLQGTTQETIRTHLVGRLSRASLEELRRHLERPDIELRRAVVKVCAELGYKDLAPDLVALLDVDDAELSNATLTTLRKVTGKDLADRTAWRRWLASLDQ
jgi:hypothetical protein